ncbi:CHAT domain-containing protein [Micromonospora sp. WMMD882]|uniref:CHAT domain-containing protein n=1 Tax=Micromonospora sp. WMMD882 TaxID=3015151 RepID=UPI00248C420C|nr:CHAT domain-containing protein [Micromonospora sp. WMMD882]WBB77764.1 CHAT domain-containing protein [Micromonospora sp. WMMD882]
MTASSSAVDRLSEVIGSLPPPQRPPLVYARCWLRVVGYETGGRDVDQLTAALADFAALPEDLPGRPRLAAVLVTLQLQAGRLRTADAIVRADAWAAVADQDPYPLPQWPYVRAAVTSLDLLRAGQHGAPGFSPHAALAELDRLTAIVGGRQPYATMLDSARVGLTHLRAQQDHDLSGFDEALAAVIRLLGQPRLRRSAGARLMPALLAAQRAAATGDPDETDAALRRLLAEIDAVPPAELDRAGGAGLRAMVAAALVPMPDADPSASDATTSRLRIDALRDELRKPGLPDPHRATLLSSLGTAELMVGADDAGLLGEAVRHLREAARLTPPHDARHTHRLMGAGTAYLRRWEVTGAVEDRAEAIRLLEGARRSTGGTANWVWTMAANPLAHAYRSAGQRDRGREVALGGLRGHAWNALVQAGTTRTYQVARQAADDALDVARWCLADNEPAAAATALEAGRGLMIHAATVTRDLATQLTERGEEELAGRWRAAVARHGPDEVPTELRLRALSAVTGIPVDEVGTVTGSPDSGTGRLLDPPTPHEIRAALLALGVDALVYLAPGDQGIGAAVLIPATDVPDWIPLPGLTAAACAEAERRVTTLTGDAARDLPSAGGGARWDGVCDWAWQVAVGPLLDRLGATGQRPARLVLVPVRELARVPWHAARRQVAGRVEYALSRAVFSYAASARLFCAAAWGGPAPLGDGGLVVGDPDTAGTAGDLPAARAEALAVRDVFHPTARYVGRAADGTTAADGPGSRAQVVDWLADPTGGGLLHLACHGVVRAADVTTGESSYLLLAGGERLAAEELARLLTARAARPVALAVLAACRSGVSGYGYDEAFSLATLFLAHHTRSVLSTQWSVPDAATSVLMFLFHHHLTEEGLRPADALRAAQLWLAGPRREPPASMPEALRRHLPAGPVDPVAWAGFVHQGR